MYCNVANCGGKTLLIFICFFSLFIKANATDNGDWWLQRQITLQQNREDYARRVHGYARWGYDQPITKDGITKMQTLFKNVVVEDNPSKSKLGKVLLERGKAYKGGIAGIVGGAAITAMIEAVGWVMEEGTWVKYKHEDEIPPNEYQYSYGLLSQSDNPCWCDTASEAARTVSLASTKSAQYIYKHTKDLGDKRYAVVFDVKYASSQQQNVQHELQRRINPNGIPENEPKKITITDQDVGGIVSGDYKDPVDSQYDINDKKYKPPVATAYEHDPTGVGEDLANEMDDRIKNAPPTSDGKPSPVGDIRYSTPPNEDEKTNDRSWEDDKANDAEGDTTPKIDPVTGEPTGGQSISITFPVFCDWAHVVCDFIDWVKKDDALTNDDTALNVEEIPLPQLETNAFNATAGCPAPIPVPINFGGTAGNIEISYEPICQFVSRWSFVAPLIAFLSGAMIIIGVGRKGEDSDL